MKIKSYLTILCLVVLLAACQKVFVPDIDRADPALVIEGYLSTHTNIQRVLISYSSSFGERPSYLKETGATVYVTDDLGNRFDYYERGPMGVYQTDSAEQVKGLIGHAYTLHIETKEGDVYESTPQTIVECADPYRLICKPATEEVLTVDAYDAPLEVYYDGIEIDLSSRGILPTGNFYQYDWDAYEEHLTTVNVQASIFYFYEHRRLSGKYFSVIKTGNADGISDHTIRDKKILFVAASDMRNFEPNIPDTLNSLGPVTLFRGLLFQLQQKSLTPEAYEFWNGAESQLNASGKLFDPVASQINGNIKCVSDSTKAVYGVFTAYDLKNKYAYFYINKSNRTITETIDSFPELVLDTFKMSPPKGWIEPPF